MKLILLTRGLSAVVDDEDYDKLMLSKWQSVLSLYGGIVYAHRGDSIRKRSVTMHQQIMNTPKGMHTDHINGNGLDNRRSNLRIVTPGENCRNHHGNCWKRKFPGMYWRRRERLYDLVHKYAHSEHCFE